MKVKTTAPDYFARTTIFTLTPFEENHLALTVRLPTFEQCPSYDPAALLDQIFGEGEVYSYRKGKLWVYHNTFEAIAHRLENLPFGDLRGKNTLKRECEFLHYEYDRLEAITLASRLAMMVAHPYTGMTLEEVMASNTLEKEPTYALGVAFSTSRLKPRYDLQCSYKRGEDITILTLPYALAITLGAVTEKLKENTLEHNAYFEQFSKEGVTCYSGDPTGLRNWKTRRYIYKGNKVAYLAGLLYPLKRGEEDLVPKGNSEDFQKGQEDATLLTAYRPQVFKDRPTRGAVHYSNDDKVLPYVDSRMLFVSSSAPKEVLLSAIPSHMTVRFKPNSPLTRGYVLAVGDISTGLNTYKERVQTAKELSKALTDAGYPTPFKDCEARPITLAYGGVFGMRGKKIISLRLPLLEGVNTPSSQWYEEASKLIDNSDFNFTKEFRNGFLSYELDATALTPQEVDVKLDEIEYFCTRSLPGVVIKYKNRVKETHQALDSELSARARTYEENYGRK